MYDAVGGRFVSRDPIGFVGSPWNLFGFVGSGPLNTNDPSGLAPILLPRFDDCFAGHFARCALAACVLLNIDVPLCAAACIIDERRPRPSMSCINSCVVHAAIASPICFPMSAACACRAKWKCR
jgi:hypothetical protein